MSVRYFIRPKADQDLDDQAFYLAQRAGPDLRHWFLVAAHETFTLLLPTLELAGIRVCVIRN